MKKKKDPFGKASCEAEVLTLGEEKYSDLYFDETPFNDVAIDDDTYLIIGRRGSGKTALAQYFSFQKRMTNPICIEVRKPEMYQQVLSEISKRTSESRVIAVAHLKRVWEFVIWSLIVEAIKDDAPEVAKTHRLEARTEMVSHYVADLIEYLMGLFNEDDKGTGGTSLERIVDAAGLNLAKQAALKMAKQRPLIIAIDTLEQYDIENESLMNALAALIEYASEFNLKYAPQSIHLKVFVSGEVFQHMKEAVLLNLSKAVRNPVYLLWRPRDLLRLIGWRFYRHLEESNLWVAKSTKIDWEDVDDVLEKVWRPHFGSSLKNAINIEEDTWPYILRHTQMRPRQLILICNSIAKLAIQDDTFPHFRDDHIINGIKDAELDLASEILNSFSAIYPRVESIVTALMKIPKIFHGNELDKRASQSAAEWPDKYSPSLFKQLVAELGIVGRVTRGTKDTEYIDADFEYASTERLLLTHRDTCVIHPMFYRKLNVDFNSEARVMPFTTKRG
jgi:hypothetical protein